MGPDRTRFASDSAYRLSYASYSARWLLALGTGLAALLVTRPWPNAAASLFVVFFLYIGFALGTLAALLAGVSFLVGALWSSWLERRAGRHREWLRFKRHLYAGVALVVLLAAYGFFAYGLVFGKTFFPSRHGTVVRYGQESLSFLLSMAFWLWACVTGPRYVLRVFREARAT